VVHTGKVTTQLGRPRCSWKIILKCIFKEWDGDVNWIYLSEDKDRWRILVNAITNSGAS
jgi:hypothetical protein